MRNILNLPLKTLPEASGETGITVEVSQHYVDMTMANPPLARLVCKTY